MVIDDDVISAGRNADTSARPKLLTDWFYLMQANHEILHGLGAEHEKDYMNIMYSTGAAKKRIDALESNRQANNEEGINLWLEVEGSVRRAVDW